MCIFLTNVLQNLRKCISAKLQDAVQDMDIPYPSQHTMSRNHRPASEMPLKCFIYCIAETEERKAGEGVCVWGGGGVGDWLESPVEIHSIFVVLICMCCCCFCTVWVGGGKLLI